MRLCPTSVYSTCIILSSWAVVFATWLIDVELQYLSNLIKSKKNPLLCSITSNLDNWNALVHSKLNYDFRRRRDSQKTDTLFVTVSLVPPHRKLFCGLWKAPPYVQLRRALQSYAPGEYVHRLPWLNSLQIRCHIRCSPHLFHSWVSWENTA